VRMVGLLAAVIGATLVVASRQGYRALEIFILGIGSASAFAVVDIWYTFRGVIAPIYLGDAVVEVGLIVGFIALRRTTS
jgi:hypothetical protein